VNAQWLLNIYHTEKWIFQYLIIFPTRVTSPFLDWFAAYFLVCVWFILNEVYSEPNGIIITKYSPIYVHPDSKG